LNSIFIYYRTKDRDQGEAESLIHSMQARLACRSGVAGRLLKKHGEPGLWMEIYEPIMQLEVFERLLDQAEDEFDIAVFIDGDRHREIFEGDASSASVCQ
jgi:Domain of unknown function (DUF4936)